LFIVGSTSSSGTPLRRHSKRQIRQIANSIDAFDFNVPILTDRDGNVITGPGRCCVYPYLPRASVATISAKAYLDPSRRGLVKSDTPELLLAHHLIKALKLPAFLREYDKLVQQCAAEGIDHPRYLLRLAELELIDRERRMVERRIREARFPTVKSLDCLDFTALPSLNKTLVLELARCEYIARRQNANRSTKPVDISVDRFHA
jgi:hypothetical protein